MEYNFDLPKYVLDVLNVFHSNSYEAYIVGGSVRDFIMGNCPHDYDITTSALPEQVNELFKNTHKVIETGIKHGTVTVICDGNPVEITTYRVDGTYLDCRRPEAVTFTRSLHDDLCRRDFTINALAYNEAEGVIDCFDGIADINSKILRCIGNPVKRFSEDALRILRALRFAVKLDFDIEDTTAESIFSLRELLLNISAERVFSELCTMFSYENKERLSYILKQYKAIFKLVLNISVSDNEYVTVCDDIVGIPADRMLCLIYFLCKISCNSEDVKKTLTSLKVSNEFEKRIIALYNILNLSDDITNAVAVKGLMRDYGADNCKDAALILASAGKNIGFYNVLKKIIDENQCYSLKQLAINGKDIMKILPVNGKAVGILLNQLLVSVINEEVINDKSALLNKAKQIYDTAEM